jgi:hypothetical protein
MIEQFMDEMRVMDGIALRGGANLAIIVMAPGLTVPDDTCLLCVPVSELQPGQPELPVLPYADALTLARSKPPGARTVLVMSEEQAERFITSRELTGHGPGGA